MNLSGTVTCTGLAAFTLVPVGAGGATPPWGLHGSVSYGSQDGSGDSIRLTNGNVTGGSYLVSVAGGNLRPGRRCDHTRTALVFCLGI